MERPTGTRSRYCAVLQWGKKKADAGEMQLRSNLFPPPQPFPEESTAVVAPWYFSSLRPREQLCGWQRPSEVMDGRSIGWQLWARSSFEGC